MRIRHNKEKPGYQVSDQANRRRTADPCLHPESTVPAPAVHTVGHAARRPLRHDKRNKPLNPTDGHIIAGTSIDQHRPRARARRALFQIAPDPRDNENAEKSSMRRTRCRSCVSVREEVQRSFEGAKKRNVAPYADYIVALKEGEDGLTPRSPSSARPCSPSRCARTAMDSSRCRGTSGWSPSTARRPAARHEAANMVPATKQEFIAVYINHGRGDQWARQAFHDLARCSA